MNVESDDGFSVSVGNPAEWRSQRLVLGDYDGGRGTGVGGTAFNFYIATAGYYPFTCLYYEGGGGNAVEWYTTAAYPANNIYCLLNDPTAAYNTPTNSVNPALQCYEYPFGKTKGSPYIASYGPSMFRGYDGTAGTSHSTHTGYDAPIWVNLVDGDNAITTSSIGLTVNGTKVTPTVVKSGSNTSVTYTNAFNWVPGTTNTVSLTFLDRTATWSFMVENHKNPTFFIEAEDFDSGGKGLPVASIMPYWGGAYVGLPATLNVDYYEPAGQNNGPWYRVSNNASIASAAPLNPNVPMQVNGDMDRGVNELAVQLPHRLDWGQSVVQLHPQLPGGQLQRLCRHFQRRQRGHRGVFPLRRPPDGDRFEHEQPRHLWRRDKRVCHRRLGQQRWRWPARRDGVGPADRSERQHAEHRPLGHHDAALLAAGGDHQYRPRRGNADHPPKRQR